MEIDISRLKDLTSVLGFLTGAASLALHGKSHWYDKYKIKCRGYMQTIVTPSTVEFDISIEIVNVGRRPISVISVSHEAELVELPSGTVRTSTVIFPKASSNVDTIKLEENEFYKIKGKAYSFKDAKKFPGVIKGFVKDSMGKIHTISIENMAFENGIEKFVGR